MTVIAHQHFYTPPSQSTKASEIEQQKLGGGGGASGHVEPAAKVARQIIARRRHSKQRTDETAKEMRVSSFVGSRRRPWAIQRLTPFPLPPSQTHLLHPPGRSLHPVHPPSIVHSPQKALQTRQSPRYTDALNDM